MKPRCRAGALLIPIDFLLCTCHAVHMQRVRNVRLEKIAKKLRAKGMSYGQIAKKLSEMEERPIHKNQAYRWCIYQ